MEGNVVAFMMANLAKFTPESELVDMLEEQISKYKQARIINNKEKMKEYFTNIDFYCSVISLKRANVDPIELVEQYERHQKAMDLLNPNKQ